MASTTPSTSPAAPATASTTPSTPPAAFARESAAVKIQAAFRGLKVRKDKRLQEEAARKIQHAFRGFQTHKAKRPNEVPDPATNHASDGGLHIQAEPTAPSESGGLDHDTTADAAASITVSEEEHVIVDHAIDHELKQIHIDLQRGMQLTINGDSSLSSGAQVKQQLDELTPEKQAQILPLLHQGIIGAALDHVLKVKIPDNPLSQAIVNRDVSLKHFDSPISIELDTEQRQVTLTFSQEVYGTVCLEDGQSKEKIMDPEANLGTLKISFTIPVEGVVPKQGERDIIIDELPSGTTYQLLPQDPLDSAFSEYMALDGNYVHISDDVPASVDNDGGGFWGARTKNLMSNIIGLKPYWLIRSLSNFLLGSSSSPIPKEVSQGQDEECENIDPEQVKEIAKAGQSVLKNIYENSEPCFENQAAIIQLMNFLYEKAHEKRQAFDEGTYVLADKDAKLFRAFSQFKDAYRRNSSHSLGEKESQSPHYGIDLPESTIRPLDKKHILFFSFTGQDGQKKLFLKPENYGVKDPRDTFFHTLEYLESLAKRNGLINPEANQQVHRKERVKYLTGEGKEIVQDFTKYIESLPNQEKKADCILKVNDWGIAYIWLWLNTYADQVRNNEILSAISNRLQENFDHLDRRTANEVIFSHEELMQGYAESSVDEAAP